MSDAPVRPEAVGTWLDDREQQVWRQWLDVTWRLPLALDRGLQEEGGLRLADFDVLVRLSEQPDGREQVADLAASLPWERSRVDQQVAAMQESGLVLLGPADDAGGPWVALSASGQRAIEAAAPAHVGLVRFLVFDTLGEDEVEMLGRITAELGRRLDDLGVRPDE